MERKINANDIEAALNKLQEMKVERPVVVCPEGYKELYEQVFPEANVIVNDFVPGDGVFIIDNEMRRMFNKQSEVEK